MEEIILNSKKTSSFPNGNQKIATGKKQNSVAFSKENLVSYDLVVFCHLRWAFVHQRPQHIISRLSKKYKVLLVEEPIPCLENERGTYDLDEISPTLHVLKPKVNAISEIPLVLERMHLDRTVSIGWFYSAAFSVLIPHFNFETIVYDCMDELSLFKGAPCELVVQEKCLMAQADVVFTGGTALYESKCNGHTNVHCFPSSVDREHFAKTKDDIAIPEDVKNIAHPIVGYFGVIDERIDYDLLEKTALSLPEVSFVMLGPLAKVSEEELPRAANIHYLGMKSYDLLPNYLKAFDIAMMPFAMNDATKYISPTKTLEYMAGGVPIISTAIKDVVRHYESCVSIVKSAEEFKKSIIDLLHINSESYQKEFQDILSKTSWNATVESMHKLIKTSKK
ncbi:glycosyltransferase family 1 protein [Aequorivita sp. H23M31]|uniref:Glycosyltransferase family 1 protein n=1 Tax=Aequorivita ciconiae TaxID=2494375 RepID=A0A410G0W3_9FLAO|nr:glycosyltransferase [Aequorivita sp. H23M31]QAA80914.1 glycosyltransferase family 1 protein [Aequorivita sp. H23M31]